MVGVLSPEILVLAVAISERERRSKEIFVLLLWGHGSNATSRIFSKENIKDKVSVRIS